ncbi:MAG: CUB domain-containing protein, partial [Flavobacterium sp.]|nr:CUB domain-containing protein [Flavobacterium sp.]
MHLIEYGQWQCASFDTFAFFLTDLSTNTTTNLAVIPSTTTPVSVLNIRDQAYNPNCTSANAGLFSTYNVTNPGASTLNMRGHTNVLNASASVTPNRSYRIRLAIGDYQDFRYDSAV